MRDVGGLAAARDVADGDVADVDVVGVRAGRFEAVDVFAARAMIVRIAIRDRREAGASQSRGESFVLTNNRFARYDARMQWLLYIVGGIVGLFIVLLGIGYLLPKDHVAARRITIARPAADVWRAITDVAAYPRWRTGVTKIERISATQFRETSSHGAIPYDIVEERAEALRITRIADPALPFGGRWIYELTADGAGTRLTITEDGFITNPIFRVLSRTVFSTTSTMEAYLTDLGRALGGNEGHASAVDNAAPSGSAASPGSVGVVEPAAPSALAR